MNLKVEITSGALNKTKRPFVMERKILNAISTIEELNIEELNSLNTLKPSLGHEIDHLKDEIKKYR